MKVVLCCLVLAVVIGISESKSLTLDRLEDEILQMLEGRAENEDTQLSGCPPIMDKYDLTVESENAPTSIEINQCLMNEFNPSAICDEFDVTMCGDSCAVGFETDENGCVMSCACKSEGIMEGDIMMSLSQASMLLDGSDRAGTRYMPRWNNIPATENGKRVYIVPYVLSQGISSNPRAKAAILAAIDQYKKQTCLRFQPRGSEKDYLEYFVQSGCWSNVGKRGGRQQLSIGRGCEWKGTVMHEMMHAMGFLHEQSRPDRDSAVQIVVENINPRFIGNFKKYSSRMVNSMGSPYDVGSIMQYGGYYFSKNKKPTIINRKTGEAVVAQRNGFSPEDLKQLNKMYKCPGY